MIMMTGEAQNAIPEPVGLSPGRELQDGSKDLTSSESLGTFGLAGLAGRAGRGSNIAI